MVTKPGTAEISIVPGALATDILWSLTSVSESGELVASARTAWTDSAMAKMTAEDLSNQIKIATKRRQLQAPLDTVTN
jgi:hypothetical protein